MSKTSEYTGCRSRDRNRLGIQTVPQHDIAIHMAHAEERGEDLPVAIALGNEPIITLMGATPLLYTQLEYKMAAVMQGSPYRVVKTAKGLRCPLGRRICAGGARALRIARDRGARSANFPAITQDATNTLSSRSTGCRIARIRIYDAVYVGRPWTEIDFLQAMTTSAPIFLQLKQTFPEVVAVNALYTHGLVVVVSTKISYGGFAKYVGLRVLTTTHGLGYAKIVIVVDEDVDPFDLKQVMWAISVKVNPGRRYRHRSQILRRICSIPACSPGGIVTKMIIDATTPVAPDVRGDYGEELDKPAEYRPVADEAAGL